MKVLKRDGSKEKFDSKKIKRGIEKAAERAKVDRNRAREISERTAKDVETALKGKDEVSSENIMETVLRTLNREEKKLAESYRSFKK